MSSPAAEKDHVEEDDGPKSADKAGAAQEPADPSPNADNGDAKKAYRNLPTLPKKALRDEEVPSGWWYQGEKTPRYRGPAEAACGGRYRVKADFIAAMLKHIPEDAEQWIKNGRYEECKEVKMARDILAGKYHWFSERSEQKEKASSESKKRKFEHEQCEKEMSSPAGEKDHVEEDDGPKSADKAMAAQEPADPDPNADNGDAKKAYRNLPSLPKKAFREEEVPSGWYQCEKTPCYRGPAEAACGGRYHVKADFIAAMLKHIPEEAEQWIKNGRYEECKEVKMGRDILAGKYKWFKDRIKDNEGARRGKQLALAPGTQGGVRKQKSLNMIHGDGNNFEQEKAPAPAVKREVIEWSWLSVPFPSGWRYERTKYAGYWHGPVKANGAARKYRTSYDFFAGLLEWDAEQAENFVRGNKFESLECVAHAREILAGTKKSYEEKRHEQKVKKEASKRKKEAKNELHKNTTDEGVAQQLVDDQNRDSGDDQQLGPTNRVAPPPAMKKEVVDWSRLAVPFPPGWNCERKKSGVRRWLGPRPTANGRPRKYETYYDFFAGLLKWDSEQAENFIRGNKLESLECVTRAREILAGTAKSHKQLQKERAAAREAATRLNNDVKLKELKISKKPKAKRDANSLPENNLRIPSPDPIDWAWLAIPLPTGWSKCEGLDRWQGPAKADGSPRSYLSRREFFVGFLEWDTDLARKWINDNGLQELACVAYALGKSRSASATKAANKLAQQDDADAPPASSASSKPSAPGQPLEKSVPPWSSTAVQMQNEEAQKENKFKKLPPLPSAALTEKKLPEGWYKSDKQPKYRGPAEAPRGGKYDVRADFVAAMLQYAPTEAESWIQAGGYEQCREVRMGRDILAGKHQWYHERKKDPNREKVVRAPKRQGAKVQKKTASAKVVKHERINWSFLPMPLPAGWSKCDGQGWQGPPNADGTAKKYETSYDFFAGFLELDSEQAEKFIRENDLQDYESVAYARGIDYESVAQEARGLLAGTEKTFEDVLHERQQAMKKENRKHLVDSANQDEQEQEDEYKKFRPLPAPAFSEDQLPKGWSCLSSTNKKILKMGGPRYRGPAEAPGNGKYTVKSDFVAAMLEHAPAQAERWITSGGYEDCREVKIGRDILAGTIKSARERHREACRAWKKLKKSAASAQQAKCSGNGGAAACAPALVPQNNKRPAAEMVASTPFFDGGADTPTTLIAKSGSGFNMARPDGKWLSVGHLPSGPFIFNIPTTAPASCWSSNRRVGFADMPDRLTVNGETPTDLEEGWKLEEGWTSICVDGWSIEDIDRERCLFKGGEKPGGGHYVLGEPYAFFHRGLETDRVQFEKLILEHGWEDLPEVRLAYKILRGEEPTHEQYMGICFSEEVVESLGAQEVLETEFYLGVETPVNEEPAEVEEAASASALKRQRRQTSAALMNIADRSTTPANVEGRSSVSAPAVSAPPTNEKAAAAENGLGADVLMKKEEQNSWQAFVSSYDKLPPMPYAGVVTFPAGWSTSKSGIKTKRSVYQGPQEAEYGGKYSVYCDMIAALLKHEPETGEQWIGTEPAYRSQIAAVSMLITCVCVTVGARDILAGAYPWYEERESFPGYVKQTRAKPGEGKHYKSKDAGAGVEAPPSFAFKPRIRAGIRDIKNVRPPDGWEFHTDEHGKNLRFRGPEPEHRTTTTYDFLHKLLLWNKAKAEQYIQDNNWENIMARPAQPLKD
eukprot:g12888.t1